MGSLSCYWAFHGWYGADAGRCKQRSSGEKRSRDLSGERGSQRLGRIQPFERRLLEGVTSGFKDVPEPRRHPGSALGVVDVHLRHAVPCRSSELDGPALLDVEEIELKEVLSDEHDVDMVEVISNLVARQTALEAGLQSTARIFDMTLLNYL